MNKSDVQAAVTELGLSPSDLFSVEDVTNDKKVRTNLQEAATRVGKERDTARERIAELENLNAETDKKLQQHTMLTRSSSALDAILNAPERKLSDKAKTFVKRNHKNFTTTAEDEATLAVDVGKFVDASVTEFTELATVFGVDVGEAAAEANADLAASGEYKIPQSLILNQTPGAGKLQEPSVSPEREGVLAEEMDPEQNALIPGGKAAAEAQKT